MLLDPPNPREGTETVFSCLLPALAIKLDPQNPREGTETFWSMVFSGDRDYVRTPKSSRGNGNISVT